jgi:hypothetical protein
MYEVMNVAAYIQEHPETTEQAINSRLEPARLCSEHRGGHSEPL